MRTTLTLDNDVDKLLRKVCEERGVGLKDVVNEALRAGLPLMIKTRRKRRSAYRTKAVDLGPSRLASLDNIAEVLAIGEGEHHR